MSAWCEVRGEGGACEVRGEGEGCEEGGGGGSGEEEGVEWRLLLHIPGHTGFFSTGVGMCTPDLPSRDIYSITV